MDEKITNWNLDELTAAMDDKAERISEILAEGSDAPSIIVSLVMAKTSMQRLMANAVLTMDKNEDLSSKVMETCLEFKKVISPAIGAAYAMALGENMDDAQKQMEEKLESNSVDIDELSNQLFHGDKDE